MVNGAAVAVEPAGTVAGGSDVGAVATASDVSSPTPASAAPHAVRIIGPSSHTVPTVPVW